KQLINCVNKSTNHKNQKLKYFTTRRSSNLVKEMEKIEKITDPKKIVELIRSKPKPLSPRIDLVLSIVTGTILAIAYKKAYYDKEDRKSTRLNSSHQIISYAILCLKKK